MSYTLTLCSANHAWSSDSVSFLQCSFHHTPSTNVRGAGQFRRLCVRVFVGVRPIFVRMLSYLSKNPEQVLLIFTL